MAAIYLVNGFSVGHSSGNFKNRQTGYLAEIDIWGDVEFVGIGDFQKLAKNSDLVCLAQLPEIEHLILYGRGIDNEGPIHFARLSSLQSLTLVETSVNPRHLAGHANLRSLNRIELRGRSVTDTTLEGLQAIQGLPHLQILEAPNVTDAGLRHLAGLKLSNLDIMRTPIRGDGIAFINHLPLESLSLVQTSIDNDCIKHVSQIQSLKFLDLGSTQVSDAGLMHFDQLNVLERLELDGAQITDAGLGQLAGLANLSFAHSR